MKYVCSFILGLGLSIVAGAVATMPASAQGLKTIVSIFGNDSMDCLTGPTACQTAQRAIDQTLAGGEVVFDSIGDFGTATINRTMKLLFPHNGQMDQPSDGGPSSANLLFNPPSDADTLTIDGLNMNLFDRNANGIQVNRGNLSIRNSSIQNIGGSNRSGILFQPTGNNSLVVDNVSIENGPFGLTIAPRVGGDVTATINDVVGARLEIALRSFPPSGTTDNILIQNSTLTKNGIGILSNSARSTVSVKNSTLSHNTTGLSRPGGGIITSLTGNSLVNNTANGTFSNTINTQ